MQQSHEPRSSIRYFAFYYGAALAVALLVLFHRFVFSDAMLDSFDIAGFGLAHRKLLGDYFALHHTIPLWDPYVLCGVPFVEAIHGGIFYPLTFIDFLGYTSRMIGFNFILHFWLAGMFAYAAARQLKLSQYAAAITGFAYAFSPLILSWVAPGHDGKIYCATMFPLVILFLDRLFERNRLLDASLLGLIYGIIIVTPHLQIAYYVFFVIFAYAVFKTVELMLSKAERRAIARRWLLLLGALVFSLALSAVQWLPSYHYITNYSPRSAEEQGVAYAGQFSLHVEELVSLGWPEFCGADNLNAEHTYWGRNLFRDNSDSVGSVTLLLALLGVFLGTRRSRFFWLALAGGVLIYALGNATPIFALILSVFPLLDSMRSPTTGMFLFLFATAVLAGMAFDSLVAARKSKLPPSRLLRYTLIAVPTLAFAIALCCSFFGESALRAYASLCYPSLLTDSTRLSNALTNLPFLISGIWRVTIALAVVSFALFAIIRNSRLRLPACAILLSLLVVNGLSANRYIRVWNAHEVADPLPVTQFLYTRAGIDRIGGYGISLTDYQIGWSPLQASYGYHGKEPSWFNDLIGPSDSLNYLRPRFLNLTGTRYLLVRQGRSIPLDGLGPVPLRILGRYSGCDLYENRNAFPRAFLVDSAVVMSDVRSIDREVIHGRIDLRHVAILEQPPTLPLIPGSDPSAAVKIVLYEPDRIVVSVNCRSNQLLILTDNYLNSWHAYADRKERPVLRVDGSFRAVEIPAGTQEVVFEYCPRTVVAGAAISLGGLCGMAIVLGCQVVQSKRKRRNRLD